MIRDIHELLAPIRQLHERIRAIYLRQLVTRKRWVRTFEIEQKLNANDF